MGKCGGCGFFFRIPEDAGDYEVGKGDCVTEKKDEKGKYWLSKPVLKAPKHVPTLRHRKRSVNSSDLLRIS